MHMNKEWGRPNWASTLTLLATLKCIFLRVCSAEHRRRKVHSIQKMKGGEDQRSNPFSRKFDARARGCPKAKTPHPLPPPASHTPPSPWQQRQSIRVNKISPWYEPCRVFSVKDGEKRFSMRWWLEVKSGRENQTQVSRPYKRSRGIFPELLDSGSSLWILMGGAMQ